MRAEDNHGNYLPEVVKTIGLNFHVEDVLKSVPSVDQAVHLALDLTRLLKEGSFHFTKFSSNSCEVLSSITSELQQNPKLHLDLDQLPLERA